MKNTRFSLIFVIVILVVSNLYLFYKLYFDNTIKQTKVINKKVINNTSNFDGIEAGFSINANSKKSLGYYSNLNDTILIWPFLKLKYFNAEENKIPTIYLYEYLDSISDYSIIDSVKYGRQPLNFINNDNTTKDLFIKLEVPREDTVDNYYISFPIFTSLGIDSFSLSIDDSIQKTLVKRFIENY